MAFLFMFASLNPNENGNTMQNMAANSCWFYKDGKLVKEKTEQGAALRFFYSSVFGTPLRWLCKQKGAARLYAALQNSFWSKRKIRPFVKKHQIKMDGFVIPEGGYRSFNDFFTRALVPGARAIETDPLAITAPADSKALVIRELKQDSRFFVKSKVFNLKTFLRDGAQARKFEGGTLMLFRLAPYDYHRYHFPLEGTPSPAKVISGSYESVNPVVYKSGHQPLHENERHVTILKTKEYGDVAIISVGAMFVGKIHETYVPGTTYAKGDEMGSFAFGGSSIVLLFEKNKIVIDKELLNHSEKNLETAVRMGQHVAQLKI